MKEKENCLGINLHDLRLGTANHVKVITSLRGGKYLNHAFVDRNFPHQSDKLTYFSRPGFICGLYDLEFQDCN